jgi:hypothetical protein
MEETEWVMVKDAARLCDVSRGVIDRKVLTGQIKSRKNPRDLRKTMVDLNELKRIFEMT